MDKMESDFLRILASYGHDIMLQRVDPNPNLSRPVYTDALERHTVRHMLPTNRSLPNSREEMQEGILNNAERIYFFKKEAHPFDNDRIYEYEGLPHPSVWSIDQSVPMRGRSGNIIYWICGASKMKVE